MSKRQALTAVLAFRFYLFVQFLMYSTNAALGIRHIFTSTDGASHPLFLLWTRLLKRGFRYRVVRFRRARRNSLRVERFSTTSFLGMTSAANNSSFVVLADRPMVLLPASTPRMTGWVYSVLP